MELAELAVRVNWVDLAVVILFITISYDGFNKGFATQIIPLAGLTFALVISIHKHTLFGNFIYTIIPFSRAGSDLLGFIIPTVIILFLFRLGRVFIFRLVKVEVISFVDRIGGVFLGMLRAFLTISIVLIILTLVPLGYVDASVKDRSLFGQGFLKAGLGLYKHLIKITPGADAGSAAAASERLMQPHWRN